MAIEISN